MSLIKNKDHVYKEYCLIGLSKFNYHIGQVLKNEGQKVTVIDNSVDVINSHGSKFDFSIVCDGRNLTDLEDIGVQFFDYVIVGVSDIEKSITICSNLKELGVKNIMAKTKNVVHQRILKSMGIFVNIIPEIEIAEKMAYFTMFDLNVELFNFDSEMANTFIIKLSVFNPDLFEKKIKDLIQLKELNGNIICIKRVNGNIIAPVSGNDVIKKSDNVSIICNKYSIKKLKEYFMKPAAKR